MKDYIEQAHQTCSPNLHTDKVSFDVLLMQLHNVAKAAAALDATKKALFYGRGEAIDGVNRALNNANFGALLGYLHDDPSAAVNILHGVIGAATEVGELVEALTDMTRVKLDHVNAREEVGDMLWYQALILKACGSDFPATMETNIAKLRARFPNRFTEYDANNRDLSKERGILEGVSPDDQKAKDRELADRIEAVWKEIGDRNWETVEAVGSPFVGIRFRDPEGKEIRGFDLTDCPQASARAELIMKTINTIPRILEILRRG